MSEDRQVIDMVNGHAAKVQEQHAETERITTPVRGPVCNGSFLRAFLLMVVRALLWLLAGELILALMVRGQIAVWLAACCTCLCVIAEAIHVDRFFRKR